jgi:hypothetical protein
MRNVATFYSMVFNQCWVKFWGSKLQTVKVAIDYTVLRPRFAGNGANHVVPFNKVLPATSCYTKQISSGVATLVR